ncbi:MAG: Crp/Fnr family transcriptional regulator [Defluviitaleaceae bacterium]|nr:Crp/Fnr family transcriptional regulator [Defluviitaleaceae bacterium]
MSVLHIYEKVKKHPLFEDILPNEFAEMYDCLSMYTAIYSKNEVILLAGELMKLVGFVLSGNIKITREDEYGKTTIVSEISALRLFGEAHAYAGVQQNTATIVASDDCEILWINYAKILTCAPDICPFPTKIEICTFHMQLLKNMLRVMATKNLLINQKNEILSKRSIREKILCFFNTYRGSEKKFVAPFNREEMADYLCVDRSALSKELVKMRNERIINFKLKEFEIL